MTSTSSITELKSDLGQSLQEFTRSNLLIPTAKGVLRQYNYEVKVKSNTKNASLKTVSPEVFQLWTNEGIPTRLI